jgi:hypothetical protein
LFESLKELPGVTTERWLEPLGEMDGSDTVVFYLGAKQHLLTGNIGDTLRGYLTSGGHAVVAFSPKTSLRDELERRGDAEVKEPEIEEEKAGNVKKEESRSDSAPHSALSEWRGLAKNWGVRTERFSYAKINDSVSQTHAQPESLMTEFAPLRWRSPRYFKDLSAEWTVLYRYQNCPVIIRRDWGAGSLVLMTDSYCFSNEALVVERNTRFLIYLLAGAKHVIFDEFHLGVASKEGLMMLIKRYRLQWVLYTLLLLAVLFVWKNSYGFIPEYSEPSASDERCAVVGSMQGFANLLKRHILRNRLQEIMVDEWKATFLKQPSMQGKMKKFNDELQVLKDEQSKLPIVDFYNRLTEILSERK